MAVNASHDIHYVETGPAVPASDAFVRRFYFSCKILDNQASPTPDNWVDEKQVQS